MPLSTLLRASQFSEADFAALDPSALRVKVMLPEGFGLDAAASSLALEIASRDNTYSSAFKLEQEAKESGVTPGGMYFSVAQGATIWTLKLDAESQEKFKQLQRYLDKNRANDVNLRVMPRLSAAPTQAESVRVWIDLRLSPGKDWIRLADGTDLSLDAYRAAHPAR